MCLLVSKKMWRNYLTFTGPWAKWNWTLIWFHWMWVWSFLLCWLVHGLIALDDGNDVSSLDSGETYEMRNNLVVRPFRTQHVIPSQVSFSMLLSYAQFTGKTKCRKEKKWIDNIQTAVETAATIRILNLLSMGFGFDYMVYKSSSHHMLCFSFLINFSLIHVQKSNGLR